MTPDHLRGAIAVAAAEADAWDNPQIDLRGLSDTELAAARVELGSLGDRLRPLQTAAMTMEPEDLELIGRVSLALRRAVYGEALAAHVLHMRQPRPGIDARVRDSSSES